MLLAAPFPMMLAWGPELIQIYNDGYRDILGAKHPRALGQPVKACWCEVWEDIAPLFERVRGGQSVEMENLPLTVERGRAPEEAFFTFSYSPIRDADGAVAGVLDVVFETTQDVHARRVEEQLYNELELERSRLKFVFQRAPAFLAILRGPEHRFELANDAYYRLVGNRDLEGRALLDALPEIRDQGFKELLDQVLDTGEEYLGREASVLLARTPGKSLEERFIDYQYLPLVERDGTRSGIITHGTDVTEHVLARRQVERLLHESEQARTDAEIAWKEAEAANSSKTDFLSAMSHELRTPLNAIGGYAELLEMGIHGPVTAAQRKALERITSGQRHLLILINDILSYARLESGQLEFSLRPLAVSALLASVEPLMLLQAQARGIALSVRACDPSLRLMADEERVRQILLNLASNAIKFTEPGGWVALSCEADDDWAHLRVQDNGRGIDPEDQSLIFDAFRQLGRRLSEPRDGVGLGLAISRDLARTMGGDVLVESAPGEGSTFTLRLPRTTGDVQT
jgi:signal transduction histidine kinase